MAPNPMEPAFRAHALATLLKEFTESRQEGLEQYEGEAASIVAQAACMLEELTSATVDSFLKRT